MNILKNNHEYFMKIALKEAEFIILDFTVQPTGATFPE